ncbi:response regulator [Spirosoma foliorum]|uniref:Response regulator n=1 Tax=Spirosoma foliorum TaxID=2710596 RepID=A0A7G5GWC6_9BACT|nr:response regulator [Spirosoma foliorum]QMW03168.1 response regulator [Spirosoma foliorum]
MPATFTPMGSPTHNQLVYLVDDDEDDVFLFEQALLSVFPNCKLRHFGNGLVMLELMSVAGNIPQLIFLDLYMPYPDGLEILMNLKINKNWSHIPVIILTGVDDPYRARLAYQMGAQTVIQKPDHYEQLLELLQVVRQYWFTLAYLPSGQS